jgi:hypothetical protein
VALLALLVPNGRAVILFDTGDPTANTTAPTGALAGSGWQFEGQWGALLGTPIAPHFFISAAHVGNAGNGTFFYDGASYSILQSYSLSGSDLRLWKVRETFTSFAPLYTAAPSAGQHLVVIGRGTRRGNEIFLDGTVRGWNWGASDGVQRWGENDVSDVVPYQGHNLLYATFDQPVQPNEHPNEAHLSSGDSGGAVFVNDTNDGTWKLAGINFSVDDLYSAPNVNARFDAAVFDARGFYSSDDKNPPTFTQIAGPSASPTGFYASEVASEIAWIGSVIAQPAVSREGNLVVLTYDRIAAPSTDISYAVQQSADLVSWQEAVTQDEVASTTGDIETVRASVNVANVPNLFLRLIITRSASQSRVRPRSYSGGTRAVVSHLDLNRG